MGTVGTRIVLSAALACTVLVCAGGSRLAAGDDGPKGGAGKAAPPAAPERASFTKARVNLAVGRGVVWLRKRQGRQGSWGGTIGQGAYSGGVTSCVPANPAGPTALTLYALLRAGRTEGDPMVQKGFDFLYKRHRIPTNSHDVSALLLAVTATARRGAGARVGDWWKLRGRYRGWAIALSEALVERRTARGWRYNLPGQPESEGAGGPEDLSSTHFAMLALFATYRCRLRPDKAAWADALSYTRDQQEDEDRGGHGVAPGDPSGKPGAKPRGFAYSLRRASPDMGDATGGMTASGVANVELARYVLCEGGKKRATWTRSGPAAGAQQDLDDGLEWLRRNWSPFRNPRVERTRGDHHCWMFTFGTAMDLLGLERVGDHEWYAEMGQQLLNRQLAAGHWNSDSSVGPCDTLDTAFALLFLTRHARGLIPYPLVTGGSRLPPGPAK